MGIAPTAFSWNAGSSRWACVSLVRVSAGPMALTVMLRGGIPASPANLLAMLDAIPEGSSWQIVSIGKYQLPLSTIAVASGGNIRVGMEDNVYFGPGELAKSNVQLVERAVRIVRELGREVATPEEAREMLHMAKPPQPSPTA